MASAVINTSSSRQVRLAIEAAASCHQTELCLALSDAHEATPGYGRLSNIVDFDKIISFDHNESLLDG